LEAIAQQDLYRIGTVASLTGLSVERLRAWERRYAIRPAHKQGKTRFYSKPQLDRLKLIKHLVDQGQAISSLAGLSSEQLSLRVHATPPETVLHSLVTPKVGLIGANVIMLEQQAQRNNQIERIEVVSRWANLEAFLSDANEFDCVDVLIAQLPVLSIQALENVKRMMPSANIICLYQFATAHNISKLQATETPTIKWPVSWAEIEHITLSETGRSAGDAGTVPRTFSDEELIAIAAESEDPHECPHHLIEAIHQLNALTGYIGDCGRQIGTTNPYQSARFDVSQARSQLENALNSLLTNNV